MTFISRRDLLKRAGAIGAAAAVPGDPVRALQSGDAAVGSDDAAAASVRHAPERSADALPQTTAAREPLENLTATEADLLEAIVACVTPSDANGLGAAEPGGAHYIAYVL